MQQLGRVLAGIADLRPVLMKDLGPRMAKPVDRLVNVPNREENIFAPNQVDQIRLLFVNVLKLVEHDLAELCADAIANFVIIDAQQIERAPFEIVEIEESPPVLAFPVQFFETRENVKNHLAKSGRATIEARRDQCRANSLNR